MAILLLSKKQVGGKMTQSKDDAVLLEKAMRAGDVPSFKAALVDGASVSDLSTGAISYMFNNHVFLEASLPRLSDQGCLQSLFLLAQCFHSSTAADLISKRLVEVGIPVPEDF